jgi:hypothetical protein
MEHFEILVVVFGSLWSTHSSKDSMFLCPRLKLNLPLLDAGHFTRSSSSTMVPPGVY